MAHVLTIANTKGGVGKSTLAVNLAVEAATHGRRTLLIDADPQASAASFVTLREDDLPAFQAVQLTQPTLHKQVPALAKGYDQVVIDVGGRDAPVMRTALVAADTVLIPMVPSAFDAWASEDIFKTIDEASALKDLAVYVVPNLVTATVSAREALEVLQEELGDKPYVRLLDAAIFQRTAWPRAVGEGMSVVEFEPKGKAAPNLSASLNS